MAEREGGDRGRATVSGKWAAVSLGCRTLPHRGVPNCPGKFCSLRNV